MLEFFLLSICFVSTTGGPPFDLSSGAGSIQEQGTHYFESILTPTIGLGIGCSIVLGILNFLVCIGCCSRLECCCKCCKKKTHSPQMNAVELQRPSIQNDMVLKSGDSRPTLTPLGPLTVEEEESLGDRDLYTKEKKRRSWFYGLYTSFFVAFLICASFVRPYCIDLGDDFRDGLTEVKGLLIDSADFVCSQSPDKASQWSKCQGDSLGGFLQDTNTVLNTNLDLVVSKINLFSNLVNGTLFLLRQASQGESYINGAIAAFSNMNSSTLHLDKQLVFLSDPANTGGASLSSKLPSRSLYPGLTIGQRSNLQNAANSLKNTVKGLNQTKTTLQQTLTTLSNFKSTIDGISGNEPPGKKDYRIFVQDILSKSLSSLASIASQIAGFTSDIDSVQGRSNAYLYMLTAVLTAFAFLPVIVVLLTASCTLCTCSCQKQRFVGPLNCSMTFMFLLNGLYGIVFGFFLAFAVINRDFCKWHLQLIDQGLSRIAMVAHSPRVTAVGLDNIVNDVLTCSSAGPKDNLVDIMGGTSKLFNVSSLLSSSFSFINQAVGQIDNSIGGVNISTQNYGGLNISDHIPFNFSRLAEPLITIQSQLPPSPFNRTSKSDQAKMTVFYKNTDFFVKYQNAIAHVNMVLGNTTFMGNQPPHNYNAQTIQFFTTWNVTRPSNPYASASYHSPHSYMELKYAVNTTDFFTKALSILVATNDKVAASVHFAIADANFIHGNLSVFYNEERSIQQLYVTFKTGLQSSRTVIGSLLTSVQFFSHIISSTEEFINTAPQYTKCGFIGNFYRTFFLGTWCRGFTSSTYNIGVTFAAIVFAMFCTHFLVAVFLPWFCASKDIQ